MLIAGSENRNGVFSGGKGGCATEDLTVEAFDSGEAS